MTYDLRKGANHMFLYPIAILMITDDSDRDFMKALYIKHQMSMFRMARALTDTEQDAEDVVSEACVSLIKKVSQIRQLDCNVLEGYIISTVKNAAYLLHRKKKARKEVTNEEILQFVADEDAAPDRNVLQECTIQELSEAIVQLPENDQVVLRMKYFEKHSDREIAKMLGIQEVSVRSRLTRMRRKIYELLGGRQIES